MSDSTQPRFRNPRPPAVAGAFYPADPDELAEMIDRQLAHARTRLPSHAPRWPKAIIVPHAGYVYSGTTAALAYALLAPGRGTIRRAVIVGPTHRVAVRGVACPTYDAFRTPLGTVPVDVAAEQRALGAATSSLRSGMTAAPGAAAPALIVNDPTHAREHAVEVQIPFLQRVLGDDITMVPLNAGLATSQQVGDVLRAFWGGPETVIVISSDLSHYHRERVARAIDDETIRRITALEYPIDPDRACGAYPINGMLDVIARGATPLRLEFLGCSTSGDDGVVALAGQPRPLAADPDDRVVGYAAWAVWEETLPDGGPIRATASDHDRGRVLLDLARAALRSHLGLPVESTPSDIVDAHPWLNEPGASFVTLAEHGDLRGCIGSLEAYRSIGRDVAEHAVDAAVRDPRFPPVTADEYPALSIEVSVLSTPEPVTVDDRPVRTRAELERVLVPRSDGLVIESADGLHRATFLPQVWDDLPEPHRFVAHLLAKAGLPASYDWRDGGIRCSRYAVTAYRGRADA